MTVLLVGSGGFATIQAAINAASAGDTILVAPGTYSGFVDVTKAVTIEGVDNVGIPGTSQRSRRGIHPHRRRPCFR